jgi:hypothetical protein
VRELRNVVLAQKIRVRWLPGRVPVEDGPVELSRDLANSALGVAPTPLPQQAFDRVDAFQTFTDGPWSAPTLPSLALQVHPLDTYPVLLSVLRGLAPESVSDLPVDRADLVRDGQVQVHMLHLRSVLLSVASGIHAFSLRSEPGERASVHVEKSVVDYKHSLNTRVPDC